MLRARTPDGIAQEIYALLIFGHAVRDHLLPARRRRTCPRVVKRAISKHRAKGDIDRNSYKITIDVDHQRPVDNPPINLTERHCGLAPG